MAERVDPKLFLKTASISVSTIQSESSTSSGSIASYPSGAEVTLFTHDPVPCSEDTVPVACSTDDVHGLAVHVGCLTGSKIPRSTSDLSLDSGAPLDDSSVSSLSVDCRCPCGKTDFTHLLDPPPDCLANRHSDALSFPEIHLKASKDKKKAQKQLKFELVEQTRCIKKGYMTLGMAVYKYALSIPRADKIMKRAILLNKQVVETCDIDELYDKFIEGADFINYDILLHRLNILKTSDTREETTESRRLAEEAAERYEVSFMEYAQRRVFLLPTILQDANGHTNSVYKGLKIKVEEEFCSFKINRLHYFEKVVMTILKLPPHIDLRVTSVRKGCVEICFEVIGSLADKTFHLTLDQKQELLSNKITTLEYGGQVAYCCCELLGDESSKDAIKKLYDGVCQADYQKDELDGVEDGSQEHTQNCPYLSQTSNADVCPIQECPSCGIRLPHCSLGYHSLQCENSDSSCSSSSDESDNEELPYPHTHTHTHACIDRTVCMQEPPEPMIVSLAGLYVSRVVVQDLYEKVYQADYQQDNLDDVDLEIDENEHSPDCPCIQGGEVTCQLSSCLDCEAQFRHCTLEYHVLDCEKRKAKLVHRVFPWRPAPMVTHERLTQSPDLRSPMVIPPTVDMFGYPIDSLDESHGAKLKKSRNLPLNLPNDDPVLIAAMSHRGLEKQPDHYEDTDSPDLRKEPQTVDNMQLFMPDMPHILNQDDATSVPHRLATSHEHTQGIPNHYEDKSPHTLQQDSLGSRSHEPQQDENSRREGLKSGSSSRLSKSSRSSNFSQDDDMDGSLLDLADELGDEKEEFVSMALEGRETDRGIVEEPYFTSSFQKSPAVLNSQTLPRSFHSPEHTPPIMDRHHHRSHTHSPKHKPGVSPYKAPRHSPTEQHKIGSSRTTGRTTVSSYSIKTPSFVSSANAHPSINGTASTNYYSSDASVTITTSSSDAVVYDTPKAAHKQYQTSLVYPEVVTREPSKRSSFIENDKSTGLLKYTQRNADPLQEQKQFAHTSNTNHLDEPETKQVGYSSSQQRRSTEPTVFMGSLPTAYCPPPSPCTPLTPMSQHTHSYLAPNTFTYPAKANLPPSQNHEVIKSTRFQQPPPFTSSGTTQGQNTRPEAGQLKSYNQANPRSRNYRPPSQGGHVGGDVRRTQTFSTSRDSGWSNRYPHEEQRPTISPTSDDSLPNSPIYFITNNPSDDRDTPSPATQAQNASFQEPLKELEVKGSRKLRVLDWMKQSSTNSQTKHK